MNTHIFTDIYLLFFGDASFGIVTFLPLSRIVTALCVARLHEYVQTVIVPKRDPELICNDIMFECKDNNLSVFLFCRFLHYILSKARQN